MQNAMQNARGWKNASWIVIQPEVHNWGEFDDEVSYLKLFNL